MAENRAREKEEMRRARLARNATHTYQQREQEQEAAIGD
jgi:hypothetical protein